LLLVFPLAAVLLLWDALFGGRVLLPAEYLKGMQPWSAGYSPEALRSLPQWNVLQWDGMSEFFPWRLHAARSMGQGQIPLWNPFILAGTPFLANSQSAPLYPIHVLYYLPLAASIAARMAWVDVIHLSLAGWFTFLLARDLRAGLLPAVAAGLTFELSGFAVAWLELPSFISVGCWIPLVLLAIGRAARWQSWRHAAGAAAAIGMMLLAGHLQIAFYGLLAAGCWWLWETVSLIGSREASLVGVSKGSRLTGAIGRGALAILGGLALAAPQMLPSMELARVSHRAGSASAAGYAGYVERALPIQNWVTLLVPDYYGLPGRGNFWGGWEYGAPNVMEYAGHVGGAALLLALLGLFGGRFVTRRVWLVAALALIGILVATGTPLNRVFYFLIPGFSQSGSPARILVLVCLAQALLAGLGLEWLLRRAQRSSAAILAPLGVALAVSATLAFGLHAIAQAQLPVPMPAGVPDPLQAVGRMLASGGVLVGLFCLLAWLMRDNPAQQRLATLGGAALITLAGAGILLGVTYNLTAAPEMAYPATPVTQALQKAPGRVATLNSRWSLDQVPTALLPPNASIAYGWRDAQAYDSLLLGQSRHLFDVLANVPEGASPLENGNIVFLKNASAPLFPLIAARWVVSERPVERAGLRLASEVLAGPPYLYEDQLAAPEAYAVSQWMVAEDAAGLAKLAALGREALANTALVPPGAETPHANPDTSGLTRGVPARIERKSPQQLVVRAEPVERSLLVLVESIAPGWTATITEAGKAPRRTPIVRTNTAFQGVFVDPGPVTVEWRYQPASFRVGLFAALTALATLLALWLCLPCARAPRES